VRIADLNSGTAKIASAYKTMRIHWEDAKDQWQDSNRKQFEEKYLDPLEPQISATLEAIGRLAEVLERAERDCE
jgi:hypothetical protein